jgi:hypothetical protein
LSRAGSATSKPIPVMRWAPAATTASSTVPERSTSPSAKSVPKC